MRGSEASKFLDDIEDDDLEEGSEFAKWRPGINSLLTVLRNLEPDDVALVLSVIKDELLLYQ